MMSHPNAIIGASPPPPPLRVAHVITESKPFGGAQRNTLLTVAGLVEGGHRVDLVCGAGGELIERAAAAGATVTVLPDLVRRTDALKDARTLRALYRLFRRDRPNVVHTHSTKAGWLGRLAAKAARVPIVIHTFHGFPFPLDGGARSRMFLAAERLLARATDCSVCVAEALSREVAAWSPTKSANVVTIYSGIDFAACTPLRPAKAVRAELGLGDAWPIVGSVGHLREAKAQEVLIAAVAMLRSIYPRIRLLIVGEGERRGFLEARIAATNLACHVSLLGDRGDVADLLGIFDVYAMSSLWEGVGRALTEAMYRRLPVVATPVYGVPELVVHEETGLLAPTRDAAALAEAIDRLVRDPALAARLGAAARRRVERRMSGTAMVAAIEQLYARLAERKLSAGAL